MPSSCRSAGGSDSPPAIAPGPFDQRDVQVLRLPRDVWAARFHAMGCPCEVLVDNDNETIARELGSIAAAEAWRIERKYSRYRDDSVIVAIHRAAGRPVALDIETVSLIEFAKTCYELSNGEFDITSGVLRRVWTFDGSERLPAPADVARILTLVGFSKLEWTPPVLALPAGMELDFGGIGKEYAVDRAFESIIRKTSSPFLVNFGGDLRASAPPQHGSWQVGIEHPAQEGMAHLLLDLQFGALATSGDTHRFLVKDGRRYGHVLDPKTGWPVQGAPRSVTVAAASCTEAGMWSTFGILKGERAEDYLRSCGRRHWIVT